MSKHSSPARPLNSFSSACSRAMIHNWASAALVCVFFFLPTFANSADTLPYLTRTRPYSGISTTIQGDIRTVGMAGASYGLADTFISSLQNPAGLAMLVNGGDANIAANFSNDAAFQSLSNSLEGRSGGLALADYPWGYSVGYVSRVRETGTYELQNTNKDTVDLAMSTRLFHLSLARILLENRLSVGAGLILGQGETSIKSTSLGLTDTDQSYSYSLQIGLSYRLPKRFIVGLSGQLPSTFGGYSSPHSKTPIINFFREVQLPWTLGLGFGWIPNRFLRADLSLVAYGITPNAALLKDDRTGVGQSLTLQPRLGIAYNLLDFKEFKSTLFYGIYVEYPRIENSPTRLHYTAGIEIKPWVFNIGWGMDYSQGYWNTMAAIGADFIRVFEKLELIPRLPHPMPAGAFPKPDQYLDDGLPETLTRSGKPRGKGIDPLDVGAQLPERFKRRADHLEEDILGLPKTVETLGTEIYDAIKTTVESGESTQGVDDLSKNVKIVSKKRTKKKLKPPQRSDLDYQSKPQD